MTIERRVAKLEDQVEHTVDEVTESSKQLAIHEERISGESGIIKTVNEVKEEIRFLKRSNYALAGSILVAAIGYYVFSGGPA